LWFLYNNNNNNNNNNNKTHIGPISLGSDGAAKPNFLNSGTPASPSNLVLKPLPSSKLLGSGRAC